jgi:hypothetical protein
MDNDESAAHCEVFGDEATTVHTSDKVNRHNLCVWVQKDQATLKLERDLPKVNFYSAVSRSQICGPFFFAENIVNAINYLDMPRLTDHDNALTLITRRSGVPRLPVCSAVPD